MQTLDPKRAVEILTPKYGSGYRIGGRLVLTAAHLFVDADSQPLEVGTKCKVRSKIDQNLGSIDAELVWKANQADVALIELPNSVSPLKAIGFGLLPAEKQAKSIDFELYGWPQWARTKRPDENEKSGGRYITGKIYLADTSGEDLLVVEPERLPEAPIPGEEGSQWEGISGAAVICNGLIVAVQRHHQNPKRPASLEAQPLSSIYGNKDWQAFLKRHGIKIKPKKASLKGIYELRPSLSTVSVISAFAVCFVFGLRLLGFFQIFELIAYDLMLSVRPAEELDKHVAILGLETQNSDETISNKALLWLLEMLNKQSSDEREVGSNEDGTVIVLDIYRDSLKNNEDENSLAKYLIHQSNIISPCLAINPDDEYADNERVEDPAHPDIPKEKLGFTNVIRDPGDVIRRHLLTITSNDLRGKPCNTPASLSLRAALQYFKTKGIDPPDGGSDYIRIGEVNFVPLDQRAGGYQDLNSVVTDENHQVMLNYRSFDKAAKKSFTVEHYPVSRIEEWSDQGNEIKPSGLNLEDFEGKIVLIGYTTLIDDFNGDLLNTPFGYGELGGAKTTPEYGLMPGVYVHAHMTSQIVNAVLEDRLLIRPLPLGMDFLIVGICVFLTGFTATFSVHKLTQSGMQITIIILLGLTSYSGLVFLGLWIPIVPSIIGIVTTSLLCWITPQILTISSD